MLAITRLSTAVAFIAAFAVAGCDQFQNMGSGSHAHSHTSTATAAPGVAPSATSNQLIAVMRATEGFTVAGTVTFTETSAGVKVVADLTGLSLNGAHAMHIHEFGDPRARDGSSAGGHYNPEGHAHGLPSQPHRHAGDLGNIISDYNGNAHYEIVIDNVTLDGKHNPIVGRGVVIHEKKDDGGQPVGNAGGRIAVGVIGYAKP